MTPEEIEARSDESIVERLVGPSYERHRRATFAAACLEAFGDYENAERERAVAESIEPEIVRAREALRLAKERR